MAKKKPHRFWRRARIAFRWSRILIWTVLLAFVISAIYLNQVGLPEFLKQPLLVELRERGWNVEFQRMRWGWFRGIVIENAVFSPVKITSATRFTAERAELNADFSKILDSKVTLKSLVIEGGELVARVATNTAPLIVKDISTTVLLLPDDRLSVDLLEAQFRDIKFQLSCDLTNVSELRELSFLLPEKKTSDAHESALKHWFGLVDQIRFADQPEIKLSLSGDVKEWRRMKSRLEVTTTGARTPWGQLEGANFLAEMNRNITATNFPTFGYELKASGLESPFGTLKGFTHQAEASFSTVHTNVVNCDFNLQGNQLNAHWTTEHETNLVRSAKAQFSGTTSVSLTNFLPFIGTADVKLQQTRLHWQQPGSTNSLSGMINAAEMSVNYDALRTLPSDSSHFGFWTNLHPFIINGRFDIGRARYGDFGVDKLLVSADWSWPRVEVMDLTGTLYKGNINAQGFLDIATRELALNAKSSFDALQVSTLLPRPGKRFLSKWTWEQPPMAEGRIRVILPEWNNPKPNWYKEILPTLQIDAKVALTNGSYRGISANRASGTIHYSNMVWDLPDIHVTRPEGEMKLSLLADDRTFTFDWNVNGVIDPGAVRSQISTNALEWFDRVSFKKAPLIEGRIRGEWGELETLGVEAKITTDEFTCRDIDFSSLAANVNFTNMVLSITNGVVTRNGKQIEAKSVILDLQTNRIYFENVASTIDPMLAAHIIGKDVVEVLSPYKFKEPPHVLLNGSLGLTTIKTADMHFSIAGKDFVWGYLRADAGSAKADWVNQTLILTNINALSYGGGDLRGNAFIDFAPKGDAKYRLNAAFTNVNVESLVRSLDFTNQTEGLLNGYLTVDSADTSGLHTWHGRGHAELKDGLIWEIRIFGIFTPILDAILPGMGRSRARSAEGSFIITNGVAYSDNLEIRSSAFRMQYKGSLSHDQRVNARVLAEPLRDTWAVGKLLSVALTPLSKLFEYQVTGPILDPVMKPVYVPKIIMMTLRPFKTLKKLLPGDKDDSKIEAPAVTEQPKEK